jgi:ATP-dependent helicase/nuclease subunit A
MTLLDAQARRRIAEATGESLFVDAGAGSGKTSALVGRVVRSVLHDGVPLAQTAVVTFTEKAGAELRDRLRAAFERVLRNSDDQTARDSAHAALNELDSAAVGTLHSFAQRILTAFPIQAGMPPLVEVLDEVGSSVSFDARWSGVWRAMLDDETLADPLLLALGSGVNSDHLRSLARAFGNDWDLIESHVLSETVRAFVLPDTGPLLRQATLLVEQASDCRDDADLFLAVLAKVDDWQRAMAAAANDRERLSLVRGMADLKTGRGRTGNWPDLARLKQECTAFADAAAEIAARIADAALRPLARTIAGQVLVAARERVATGQLEFHDLLVASRDLLRSDGAVRAALQSEYRRILLDEFQDTDPIQIELAVRIAGGEAATADDWRDVVVPAGSIFVVGDPKQSIYRFRRASIETYLSAGRHFGDRAELTTNFRTVEPVLEWVNAVFGLVIVEDAGKQPPYVPLTAHRKLLEGDDHRGPAVTVLGAELHQPRTPVAVQREAEAADVAAAIRTAIAEGWTVYDEHARAWRPLLARDIAILLPARTSLPFLEAALESAGIPYRAESSSLVYQSDEVRALMAAARAIADPSDQLSCVTALRTALFGCGDDDLYRYRRAGGRFIASAPVADELQDTPVGRAMVFLNQLYRRSRWLTPAEVLTEIAVDRRMLEVAQTTERDSRAREQWGRLRFVIDQARAWSDTAHGGLREYLAWSAHQALDAARVAEALLPETDLDVVRIMTIHAAKGLEFGMVVLSGMTSQPNRGRGVRLLWQNGGYEVKIVGSFETNDFAAAAPLDEQMDDAERRRLLYVAATRARDHLVVSLHRAEAGQSTAAKMLVDAGGLDHPAAQAFSATGLGADVLSPAEVPVPGRAYDDWLADATRVRERSRQPSARTASGLEGTEPEVQWAFVEAADPAARERIAGEAKGPRDVELPPWLKGRYGDLIGRAVHGTLQVADGDEASVDAAAAAQSLAEGIPELSAAVARFARSALATDTVRTAFGRDHWAELYVGTIEDDLVLEGFIDLVYREASGDLVIIDYKTDTVTEPHQIEERVRYYAPQVLAYVRALEAATGERARAELVFLNGSGEPGRVARIENL